MARLCHAPDTWGDALAMCWIVMPDHWHGLVQIGPGADLSRCIARFKALTARSLRCDHHIDAEIWQSGFHDHAVRRDEDLRAMARYLILNPVRAGLAACVGDYPYWNAGWL